MLDDNYHFKGLWFSGYNAAFTRQRSPVQIRTGPLKTKIDFKIVF